ncbi:hypothetical protein ACTXT7_015220 [Hymenolepis weldensis]
MTESGKNIRGRNWQGGGVVDVSGQSIHWDANRWVKLAQRLIELGVSVVEVIGKLTLKLDYIGIAILVVGSFVPWIHYSFYCHMPSKIIYISGITILGIISIIISSQDRFCKPKYRGVRAGQFLHPPVPIVQCSSP